MQDKSKGMGDVNKNACLQMFKSNRHVKEI